jgi:hypothetical protein
VKLRIVMRPAGEIDGIPLNRFQPGVVYEVDASIGTYLVASGYAQVVMDQSSARVAQLDLTPNTSRPDNAADRGRDRLKKR